MTAGKGYDIIGDVHGRIDKLHGLLDRLGYHRADGVFVPPTGRKALFLGDLIDPKPGHVLAGGVRATLEMVKAMTDRGDALCILGNHEFNAVCYHTPGEDDGWLRERTAANVRMHQGTLDDFPDYGNPAGDWLSLWLPWFKTLPMFLEIDGFRAVHACWHPGDLGLLKGRTLEDDSFLRTASRKETAEGNAIETVLKGIEIPLPPGAGFVDHTGKERMDFRVKWWEAPAAGASCRDLVFPANAEIPEVAVPESSASLFQAYPEEDPPVFFGHYFKPGDSALAPERANVACLDFSASKNGPLVCYRWQGESRLSGAGYVTS